jgi:mRNA interferase MazF
VLTKRNDNHEVKKVEKDCYEQAFSFFLLYTSSTSFTLRFSYASGNYPHFHRRHDTRGAVWYVDFDPAMGSEIQKTRPAVIVSDTAINAVMERVTVVPFTSNTQRLYPAEAKVLFNGKPNKAMADQIMAADKSRLKHRVGTLAPEYMSKVEAAIRQYLQLYLQDGGGYNAKHTRLSFFLCVLSERCGLRSFCFDFFDGAVLVTMLTKRFVRLAAQKSRCPIA